MDQKDYWRDERTNLPSDPFFFLISALNINVTTASLWSHQVLSLKCGQNFIFMNNFQREHFLWNAVSSWLFHFSMKRAFDLQTYFVWPTGGRDWNEAQSIFFVCHSVALACANCGDLSWRAAMPETRNKSQSCGLSTVYLLKYHRILKQSHICCFWRPRTFRFLSLCFHKGTAGNPWAAAEATLTRTKSPTQKRLPTTVPVHSQI